MGKYSKFVNDDNLLAEMARNRLSYREMAILMGKRRAASFSDLLYGRIEPRITDMIIIAQTLMKPVEYFFNFELRDTSNQKEQESA